MLIKCCSFHLGINLKDSETLRNEHKNMLKMLFVRLRIQFSVIENLANTHKSVHKMLFVSPSIQFSIIFAFKTLITTRKHTFSSQKITNKCCSFHLVFNFGGFRKNHIFAFKTLIPTRKTTFSSQKILANVVRFNLRKH